MLAEEEVGRCLVADGWCILARNWRGAGAEIDLIVSREQTVHFVEVKARRGAWDNGLAAVTHAKRRRLVRAATAWLDGHTEPVDGYRLSIATVARRRGSWHVEWWWDAFDA